MKNDIVGCVITKSSFLFEPSDQDVDGDPLGRELIQWLSHCFTQAGLVVSEASGYDSTYWSVDIELNQEIFVLTVYFIPLENIDVWIVDFREYGKSLELSNCERLVMILDQVLANSDAVSEYHLCNLVEFECWHDQSL